jgi:hypothetical protein
MIEMFICMAGIVVIVAIHCYRKGYKSGFWIAKGTRKP